MGIKTRIIPVLLWDEHGCVKGRQFNKDRRIGSMLDRLRLLERRDVDELIILDVSATPNNRPPRFDEIKQLTGCMFCPVTIGGGIRSCEDIRRILACGADKVAINSVAIEQPLVVRRAAERFGSQSLCVGLDVREGRVIRACGRADTGLRPEQHAKAMESLGAGEILLTSIDRDGTLSGYDLPLIRSVSEAVDIPVIAAGGCGTYEHMREAIDAGAHAVASGAMFQFCEATPKGAARYLQQHGIATRV